MNKAGSMKILIIGGSGGLSTALAKLAQNKGNVWTVTRGKRALPQGVTSIVADRNREDEFRSAILKENVQWDVVFDCICMNEYHARQDLEVFAGVTGRLVVISTDSVYDPLHKETPQTEEGVFVEESGPPELCSYAGNKRKMEQVFEEYFSKTAKNPTQTSLQITIFRPGHIYGPGFLPGCYPEQSRQADLPEKILRQEPLRLVAEGIYLIQPVFGPDLAETMLDCVDKPKSFQKIFCIGGPRAMENRRYYEIMGELLGVPVRIEEIPLKGYFESHPEYQGHLCHRIYDLSRLKEAGVKLPATEFREGMRIHLESLGYATK